MKFYEVTSTFNDKGYTTANMITVTADKKPENTFESLPKYDRYKDYFDDPKEAAEFRQQVLNENKGAAQ